MGMFGQFAATTQFFLFGKRHCTATGWQRHAKQYADPTFHDTIDLKDKVFVVTGANAGIGLSLSTYLAGKGATLYMVCRNAERAESARSHIVQKTGNDRVQTLIADCSLGADMHRMIKTLEGREQRIDGLVCNAGAITKAKTLTAEGLEVTFATHLCIGSHLLARLALPLLKRAAEPRVVFVSSGGMYNFPWEWQRGTSEGLPDAKYDGTSAYAFAKRGQVLLAEEMATREPSVSFVSAHPGWVDTPGVDAWLGGSKGMLAPLRTPWQGTEGIAWLCAVPSRAQLQPGAFYLDREPQRKHLAGPFFTEGTHTKNSPEEVQELMARLEHAAAAASGAEVPPMTPSTQATLS